MTSLITTSGYIYDQTSHTLIDIIFNSIVDIYYYFSSSFYFLILFYFLNFVYLCFIVSFHVIISFLNFDCPYFQYHVICHGNIAPKDTDIKVLRCQCDVK
jgi:hypothetical protein